jgi:hypothetical protein
MAHRAYRFVEENNQYAWCCVAATRHQAGKRIVLFQIRNAGKG